VFGISGAVRNASLERLEAEAEIALDRHARDLVRTGMISLTAPAPSRLSAQQRAREVSTARTMLPFATEQFRVVSGREEIEFLFFRPAAGCIAVYDPISGTASAETTSTNGAKIVELIATRLGYHVTSVQKVAASSAALPATTAALVSRL